MSVDRDALFKQAKSQRKEDQKNENRDGGGNFTMFTDYAALETDQFKLFRFLGLPMSISGDDPFSPKLVNISMISGDDDKKFRCVWPDRSERSDWILWKIFSKVLAYNWDAEKEERNYNHRLTHPSIFNKVRKNGKVDNIYEKGWEPAKFIIWNVIDKSPKVYDWHKENKKTLILSKKASVSRDGNNVFYEPGVPLSVYNIILDEVVEVNGDWEKYDIFVQKKKSDPWYNVYHSVDDLKKVVAKNDWLIEEELDEKGNVVTEGGFKPALYDTGFDMIKSLQPLTPEEQAWEQHNISNLYPITTYSKIYNRLKLTINQIDAAFGTKYLEELEYLKDKEVKEKKEQDKATQNSTPTETHVAEKKAVPGFEASTPKEEVKEEVKEEAAPVRRRPKAPEPEVKGFDLDTIVKTLDFKSMSTLTDEQRKLIVGYDEDKESFIYDTKETVYECLNADEGCKMQSPESFSNCPACGAAFV